MGRIFATFGIALLTATGSARVQVDHRPRGVALTDLSWKEAEAVLTDSAVVVIPLGAASVEYGPHLKLNFQERIARYLAARVQSAASVVIAPPLTYHFYPAFLQYPGSTSLTESTAREMTIEIVRTLARYGPRRFYVLNVGMAPLLPLSEAAKMLANDGIVLGYTDPPFRLQSAAKQMRQAQIRAPHADEAETSMMLFVDAAAVDMAKAQREYGAGTGPLTRTHGTPGLYSESGVIGDPSLATKEKGEALVELLVAGALEDIENVRNAPLPVATTAAAASPPSIPRAPAARQASPTRSGCSPGDERFIREIGPRFSTAWARMDAEAISQLFTFAGDMRHPDGTIERTADVIRQNRQELFRRREYRGSVHPVTLNDIRCLGGSQAIADGKWELRFADSPGAPPSGSAGGSTFAGLCTLVLSGGDKGWLIEAWRYTVTPQNGPPPPTILKQPGFIGRGQ